MLQHPTCSAQYRNLSHGIGAGEASCILPSSAGSDHGGAQFEHSSLPGTIKNLFNLTSFLTKRDAWAGDVSELLTDLVPTKVFGMGCSETLEEVRAALNVACGSPRAFGF